MIEISFRLKYLRIKQTQTKCYVWSYWVIFCCTVKGKLLIVIFWEVTVKLLLWQYSYGTPVVIQACYKHTFMTRKILYPLKFHYLGKFFEILLKLSRKTTFRKFYEFQYTFDLLSCSIRPAKTIWALYLVNGSLLPNKSGMLSSKQFILK